MTSSFMHDLDEQSQTLLARGDLDEEASLLLRETILTATDGLQRDLTIDLNHVSFLPSSAIGVLATSRAAARRNGADIRFVAADGSIAQRVLHVCGLECLESVPGHE